MHRNFKYTFLVLGGLLLAALYSCGKVTNSNLLTGNPSDPAFLAASEVLQESSENTQGALLDGLGYTYDYLFPPPLSASASTETVIYAYENGWHHLIVDYTNDTTGSTLLLDDSVQFKDSTGAVQQYPDTNNIGSIEVRVKRYVYIAQYDTTEDFQFKGNDTLLAALTIANNFDSTVTLNAFGAEGTHGTFLHPDSGVECTLDATLYHSVNNLIAPVSGNACPLSGQLSASGSLNIACPFTSGTVTASGTWSWIANIGANFVTLIAQHNNTRWVVVVPKSEFCSDYPVVAREILPGRFMN